jgi:hypothetical protein
VSLFLRRLAAEVADGAPTLVWSDRFDPEHGEMSLGQARFDSLALDQARYLHPALRQVPTVLEATNSGRPTKRTTVRGVSYLKATLTRSRMTSRRPRRP